MTDDRAFVSTVKNGDKQGLEERAYRTVFDAMKKGPSYKLPSNFADKVMVKIEMASQRSSSRELVWLYLGLASFVIAAGVAMVMTNFGELNFGELNFDKIDLGALKFISGYPGLFIFGGLFILGLQWIDKKFIHPKQAV